MEAAIQASQLEYVTDMRIFVARYRLAVDTCADARMQGVKSSTKAQVLAWCGMRLLALRRALELRTISEKRAFIEEHELAVGASACEAPRPASRRRFWSSVVLQAKY